MELQAATATTVTLRAGKNNHAFSLIELLLVLVLLGLGTYIALPAVEKGIKTRQARLAALHLAATARELSSRARIDGVPRQLTVNLASNSYFAGQHREVQLPPELKLASVEGGETLSQNIHQFVFFPNGSNLGGRIDLVADASSVTYSIRLHPLTGRVEVSRDGQ
jgi:prepilin-type N-terminal cleavage/methylation domain-containing protein